MAEKNNEKKQKAEIVRINKRRHSTDTNGQNPFQTSSGDQDKPKLKPKPKPESKPDKKPNK